MSRARKLLSTVNKRIGILLLLFFSFLVSLLQLYPIKGWTWPVWTGFGAFTAPDGTYYPAKNLWDWFELLIIPAVLALGAIYFNRTERKNELRISEIRNQNEQALAEKRAMTDRLIAQDQLRESTLQVYLDHMSELLLEKNLRTSNNNSEMRNVARTKTLTTLRRLDSERKGILVKFLYEAQLIIPSEEIINLMGASLDFASLEDAELRQISLKGASIRRANFRATNLDLACLIQADLQESYLYGASLIGCDLRSTTLSGANFWGANLYKANLSGAFSWKSNLMDVDKSQPSAKVADFSRALLHFANLQDVSLIEAIMVGADLGHANLENAHLAGSNLFGANLRNANLLNADLKGVDLSFANLTGANVHSIQLHQAKSLTRATLPNGSVND